MFSSYQQSRDRHPVHMLQQRASLQNEDIPTELCELHKQTVTQWEAMQTKRDFTNDSLAVTETGKWLR